MAITPSTVTLHHKLYTTGSSSTWINLSEPPWGGLSGETRELIVLNKPNWVNIVRTPEGTASVRKKFGVGLDSLSVGTHTVNLTLKLHITEPDDGPHGTVDYEITLGTLILKMIVTDTQLLELTPTTAVFEYQLQGTQPAQQLITVLSENSWTVTKTKNWVTLSAATGINIGSFYIGVIPSGLSVGTHTDTITVEDSFSHSSSESSLNIKTVAVSLVISEADTETTYLYVSPSAFNLNYTIGGFLTEKIIEYNASGNWTAIASESWVSLSATSGVGGVGTVQLTLQNTSSLTEGVYTAEVSFLLAGLDKKVYLTLNVFDFIVDVLNPNQIYFTKENNLIEISSQQTETHLALSMATNYEGKYFVSKKVLPFYNGSATRRIGAFPHTIISERPMLQDIHAIDLIAPYDPVEINLTVTEEDLLSDIVHQVVPVNGVRFLKGIKPSSNWLTDMPLTRHLTKKGILTFSVLADGLDFESIVVTGAISATYNFTIPQKLLYTAIVPLSELGSLNVGDTFEVDVASNKVIVNIIPEGNDHCSVFWEMSNGVWDCIEFTGDIIETHKPKSTSFEFVKDHNTSETKVIETTTTILYKINTGWIYNTEDLLGLSKLLDATNVYIQFKGKIIKVNPKTKSLEFPKPGEKTVSYDLIFENVEK